MKIVVSILLVLFLVVGWIAAMPKSDTVDVSRELQIAREQMDQGAYGSGITYYRRAAEKSGSPEVQVQLFDAYVEAGQLKEARYYMESLLETYRPRMETEPELVYLYGRYCDLLADMGDGQSYADAAREACAVDKTYFDENLSERYFALKYAPVTVSSGFVSADNFRGSLALAYTADGGYFVDGSMHLLLGPFWEAAPPISSLLALKDENGWRFVNSSGQLYMSSDKQYDKLWSGSGSYGLGLRDGQYYYLNDHCQEVLGPYDEACSFANGVAAVREGNEWRLINAKGETLGSQTFSAVLLDEMGSCSLGKRIFARTDRGWQLFDLEGKPLGDGAYEDAHPFCGGSFAAVKLEDGWAFVDMNGKICCGDRRYEDARSGSANYLAAVKEDGKWGFILAVERVGEEVIAAWKTVIEPAYEDAGVFGTDRICPVKMNGSWYYIKLLLN